MTPIPEDFYLRACVMYKDKDTIDKQFTLLQSHDNPSWARSWNNIASQLIAKIDHSGSDLPILKKICATLSISCYPYIKDSQRKRNYANLKLWYKLLCIEEKFPVKYQTFTYKSHTIPFTTRHASNSTEKRPVILMIRGLDSTKEVRYWDETLLLKKGYSIISVDFPGMGENPAAMSIDSNDIFSQLIIHIQNTTEYQDSKFVCWGLGFGGYWAFKLAAKDDNVLGAINQGGPIHYGFKPNIKKILFNFSEIRFLSNMIKVALQKTISVRSFISKLSLLKQDILKDINKPVLYINGNLDKTASIKDSNLLYQHIPNRHLTNYIVNNAGHLAIDALDDHVIPKILIWLEENYDSKPHLKQPLMVNYA